MKKAKKSKQDGKHALIVNDASNCKQASYSKDNVDSACTSFSQDHDSNVDGSPSITTNIRKLIKGKIHLSAKATSIPSHSQFQNVDCFVDAVEEVGAKPNTIDVDRDA